MSKIVVQVLNYFSVQQYFTIMLELLITNSTYYYLFRWEIIDRMKYAEKYL
jgi:hypothetical protein